MASAGSVDSRHTANNSSVSRSKSESRVRCFCFKKIFAPVFGGRILNSRPPFSLPSAPRASELVIRNGHQSYSEFQGFAKGERISCFISGPSTEAAVYGRRSEKEKKRSERKEAKTRDSRKSRSCYTKLLQLFVFIGCFFWLHFFSNCCSYEQEGVQPSRAAPWREAGGHSKDRQEGRAGRGGSELCTVLGGDTHQSISFWQFHGSLSNRIQMHLRESF